jgi:preprotein translocase subunit SecD
VFADFERLKCTPSSSQTTVNDSWKKTVDYTDSNQWDNQNVQIVSCDSNGTKYVLDKAVVLGTNVKSATATLDSTGQWIVNIALDGPAVKAWSDLTTTQFNQYYPSVSTNSTDAALDSVATVLDGDVIVAAETDAALTTGSFEINGGSTGFTQTEATYLQNVLKYGALPLSFDLRQDQTISPQLASASLTAGLIAAVIGLALVVAYCFLYYRGLGLVSISSLLIAAMMGYLAVVLLTRYQGFTLSLPGIAGLVVAIGITADSFVVFFERLRDEVRDGKQLRPAVESGWKRARRTVLVSDTVSFLAALVLYELAIGDVRGFAYTLGLTTIIDVVVVFLFTKPMVTVLAGTKFFSSGHPWSGLDPARLGARTPWRSSAPRTVGRARTAARGSSTTRTSPTNPGEA